MTREYSHDDICRGAVDGCDCDQPDLDEIETQDEDSGFERCLRCGMPAKRYFCSQECEDAERFAGVMA